MLTNEERKLIPNSYDIIGDILIFSDFPRELKKKEKEVGDYFLKNLSNICTVAKKSKKYSGKFRTPKLKILSGENRKETTHRENGVFIRVNLEKAYFSPRLGNERLRISKLVKKGELVLVMFSGVAPYPLTISKNSKAKEIYAIEENKQAHKFAEENLKINKIKNVKLFKGDVNKILPKINKKFDRIIMPLPTDSEKYLDLALTKIKSKGKIHLYLFEREENFKKLKQKYRRYRPKLIKAGCPNPGTHRVCLDLKV